MKKIVIHNTARNKIRNTARYIHKEFGVVSRIRFVEEVGHTMQLLKNNPGIGAAERYLEGAPVLYRSVIIQRLNKIIYWENGDTVEIVDFWNCRREPVTQAKHLLQ